LLLVLVGALVYQNNPTVKQSAVSLVQQVSSAQQEVLSGIVTMSQTSQTGALSTTATQQATTTTTGTQPPACTVTLIVVPDRSPAEYNVGDTAYFQAYLLSNNSPCTPITISSLSYGVEYFDANRVPLTVLQFVQVSSIGPIVISQNQRVDLLPFSWNLYDGPPPNGRPVSPGNYIVRVSLLNNNQIAGEATITMLFYGGA